MAPKGGARDRLLDTALAVIREKGYAATSVDELCTRAGVTKGAFFHHFDTKQALAVAAAQHWSAVTGALFATASYHQHADPLDRVLAYLDFRRSLIKGETPEYTCLVGTMVQEAHVTNPAVRDACAASIFGHAQTLAADIRAAMKARGIGGSREAESLARHTQAVLQGAFILAKAKGDPTYAIESIDHLQRYIRLLFDQDTRPKQRTTRRRAA